MTDMPFERSNNFSRLTFTGRYRNYTNADTFYPSWAEDGHLYSPWTDGAFLDSGDYDHEKSAQEGYRCNSLDWEGRRAATAQAKIVGDDPLRLTVINIKPRIEADPAPYGGRYPCGTLVHNGIWYYGTYCVMDKSKAALPEWTDMGPLVGFRWSTDYGRTWTETPHTPTQPLFGEDLSRAKIKLGAPHFVDFGKNMRHSPDAKAYLVGHGATRPDAVNSWVKGDQVYMARVTPTIDTMNDPAAYEFFAGYEADGRPRWSERFADIRPLLEWQNHLGIVTITYNGPLKKYLMFITDAHHHLHYDLLVLESDAVTGPWKVIRLWEKFGPAGYFVNLPTKFINEDGKRFWLLYSANWYQKTLAGDPDGSAYSLSLHEAILS